MTVSQNKATCSCGMRHWLNVEHLKSPPSCLNTFFNRFCTGARSLVSYSDSCGGQNKNLAILGMLAIFIWPMFINQLTTSTWREATPTSRMTVTLALLKKGSRVFKSISQETFQDSQLGIKWEIFPLLGKTWDKKFLFWDNFGK